MKTWQKILSVLLIAVLIVGTAVAILYANREKKPCCLCDRGRYHAPCLIDLETGQILELAVYEADPFKEAALSSWQPSYETMSLISFGDVSGYVDHGSHTIHLIVPISPFVWNPALCGECGKQMPTYHRYALADLYQEESVQLFPCIGSITASLRCYDITTQYNDAGTEILVTIQGTWGD